MSAVEVVLIAINGAGVLSFISYQMKLYSDVQVLKTTIDELKNKINRL